MSTIRHTRIAVYLSLGVALFETSTVAAAAAITGSSAVLSQTFANLADVGVQVFLVIAVVTSARAADASHPLGYGRERFFWSLFAAIGVFTGGCVAAFEEAIRSGLHPSTVKSFTLGYAVLALTIVLDAAAFAVAARTVQAQAGARGVSARAYLRRTTEPAARAAFLAAGEPIPTAQANARTGGLFTIQRGGLRIQITWKTLDGGNHYHHVHVGVRSEDALSGEGRLWVP